MVAGQLYDFIGITFTTTINTWHRGGNGHHNGKADVINVGLLMPYNDIIFVFQTNVHALVHAKNSDDVLKNCPILTVNFSILFNYSDT